MRFYVHKLGCPKNDVDADYISARLIAAGHEPVSSPDEAESIIVNTCSFILPAKEESINEILRLGRLKKEGSLQTLYATGCLSQRNGDELLSGMPELDGAFGLGTLDSIAEAVSNSTVHSKTIRTESRQLAYLDFSQRYLDDTKPYAYLKISDGCNRYCSYCAIPSIRGKFRSRSLDSIMREAEFLVSSGKIELILVSQEATRYGYDLSAPSDLIGLLKSLESIEELKWIRPMYLHPAEMTKDLIDYMTSGSKTLSYFDLPLQHINSEILAAMNRQIDRSGIERLLGAIRTSDPEATIRTTFISGFPGETDHQHREIKDFVADFGFDRLGVFPYSREEGTAAESLAGQVAENEKTARVDEIMQLQQEIAVAANNDLIGKKIEVIIDAVSTEGKGISRSRGDCPDIDQEIALTGSNLEVGQLRPVIIDSADGYDLSGHTV